MQLNLTELAKAAAQTGVNQSVIKTGGDLPAEGPCQLRLIGYIEVGKHKKKFKNVDKVVNKAVLIFEVVSKRHIRRNDSNEIIPTLISLTVNLSQSQRANWPKLFSQLNYDGQATHCVQLLGRAYLGEIFHREYDAGNGEKRKAVDLNAKGLPTVLRAPKKFDEDTGEYVPVDVPQPNAPLRALLWGAPSADQWASIFIDGKFEEERDESGKVVKPARSKNRWQEMAKSAIDFSGSPLESLLVQLGANLTPEDFDNADEDDGESDSPFAGSTVAVPANANDPLAGVQLA